MPRSLPSQKIWTAAIQKYVSKSTTFPIAKYSCINSILLCRYRHRNRPLRNKIRLTGFPFNKIANRFQPLSDSTTNHYLIPRIFSPNSRLKVMFRLSNVLQTSPALVGIGRICPNLFQYHTTAYDLVVEFYTGCLRIRQ